MDQNVVRCALTGEVLFIVTTMGVDMSSPLQGEHLALLNIFHETQEFTLARCRDGAIGYGRRVEDFLLDGFFADGSDIFTDEKVISELISVEEIDAIAIVDVVLPDSPVVVPGVPLWTLNSVCSFFKTSRCDDVVCQQGYLISREEFVGPDETKWFAVCVGTCSDDRFVCRLIELSNMDGHDVEGATSMALDILKAADEEYEVCGDMYTTEEMVRTRRMLIVEKAKLRYLNQTFPPQSQDAIKTRNERESFLKGRIASFESVIRDHLPEEEVKRRFADECPSTRIIVLD